MEPTLPAWDDPGEWIVIGLLLLFLISIAIYSYRHWSEKRQKAARIPQTGAHPSATVVSKRLYPWLDRIGFYVTFQVAGYEPVELEVAHDWYDRLNPGDSGALTLQNGQFRGFSQAG